MIRSRLPGILLSVAGIYFDLQDIMAGGYKDAPGVGGSAHGAKPTLSTAPDLSWAEVGATLAHRSRLGIG